LKLSIGRLYRLGRLDRLFVGCLLVAGVELIIALVDTDVAAPLVAVRAAIVALLTVLAVATTIRKSESPTPSRLAAAGACALLLGTMGVGAGAVIGVAGLLVEGPSPTALFGVVALAAALALTVVGISWLLRSLPNRWQLLGIPGTFLVAQFWLLPVVMAMLGTHAPQAAFTAQAPAGAQRVTFAAADGTALAGWYTPSTNGATVIVLAGAGGTKADTAGQAAVLARHGYGVLAYDTRGSGESGGHSMLWGWGGERDLGAAVTYLESRADVDRGRIGVLGLSMGGEIAITGAALDPRLKAVVAEGAAARTCADLSILPTDMEGVIHRADSCLGWSLAGLMTNAPEPQPLSDAVRALGTRPLLLIAADLPEERAATSAWHATAPATIQLWQPANTAHTAGLATHAAEWESRVIAFLDASL
jgi:alpha/beta superfamily hydrolase